MESSKISVKKSLTIMCAGFALLMSWRPAIADGPNLIHTEAVGQITITSLNYYPMGCTPPPEAGCTYYTLTGTTSGRNTPLGPFVAGLTATVLFSVTTPNGDPDQGAHEVCSPEIGTETDTFADGSTLKSDFQGLSCCAAKSESSCANAGLPSVNHDSSVIIEGTGRLAGASGGTSWSDNFATLTGPLLMHAEGVLQLPGNSGED